MGSLPGTAPIIAVGTAVGTAGRRRFWRIRSLPAQRRRVLEADLNRSESGASGQQSHDWTTNHCRGDGSQMMRSIGRVEAPRWLSDESLKAAGARTSEPIEIFWGNPMPGTANGREPGKKEGASWSLSVCPWTRREDLRLPSRVCPHGTPTVLGINLNCSESRWRPGRINGSGVCFVTNRCRAPTKWSHWRDQWEPMVTRADELIEWGCDFGQNSSRSRRGPPSYPPRTLPPVSYGAWP